MEFKKTLYSVEESLECNGGILPMSKSTIYKLIREKVIPSQRIGKRVFILGSYIRSLAKQE